MGNHGMESQGKGASPGWYPTPDGSQRYWDGEHWLSIPPPDGLPEDDGPKPRRPSRRAWVAIVGAVLLIAVVVSVGFLVKAERDRELAAAEAAAAEEIASAQAAEEAASAQAVEEAAAAAAAEQRSQQERDDRERDHRREAMASIETSVEEMAEGHIDDGIIDGPVLAVSCSPVAGGSIDDLTEQTTVFDCFVATEDNGDGTMSGISYNATMNWTTGSYTYRIGAP